MSLVSYLLFFSFIPYASLLTSSFLTLPLPSFLSGFDVDLTLNFLFKRSHTDVNILKEIKAATEGRSNVLHNATVVAHAYMNAGKMH